MGDELEENLGFEWDKGNVDKNWKKHRVTRKESEEIFFDRKAMVSLDVKHLKVEKRWLLLGATKSKRRLGVVFTKRKSKVRVISARSMNKKERIKYEKQEIINNP